MSTAALFAAFGDGNFGAPPKGADKEYKHKLQIILQKKLGGALKKGSIQYRTTVVDGGHQCTMTLKCLDDTTFVGDIGSDQKIAEQNAAQKAVELYAPEIGEIEVKVREKPRVRPPKKGAGDSSTDGPDSNPKHALQIVMQKKMGTHVKKGDFVYSTEEVEGGYQCSLSVGCDEGMSFVGDVSTEKKEAEDSAARQAVAFYLPEVGDINIAPKRNTGGEESPKHVLQVVLQKFLTKALQKGEIQFDTNEVENGSYQCTLTLLCCDGKTFTGEVCSDRKQAEDNAANQAVEFYKPQVGDLIFNKRSSSASGEPAAKRARMDASDKKNVLLEIVTRIKQNTLAKGDMQYDTSKVATDAGEVKHQCTLTISVLPGYEGVEFTGQTAENPKDAEQSAAQEALNIIEKDTTLQELLAKLKPLQKRTPYKNKGQGQWNDDGYNSEHNSTLMGLMQMNMDMMSMMNTMMMQMPSMRGGNDWGNDWGKGGKGW